MRRIAILACFVAAVSGESSSAIDANDYRVFWQGRTRRGGYDGTSVAFDWEAVSFTVSVTGATQVTAVFNPMLNLNTKVAIIVNGDDMGRMYINNTLNTYTIAANLNPSTTNVVEVFNTMEPMHIFGPDSATAGVLQAPSLSSVVSDGTFNIPPQPFKHKLLVIGDSITAGSGAAGSPPCHGDLQTSDAFVSYEPSAGSLLARNFSADLLGIIGWSGIGVYENCCDNGETMPQLFMHRLGWERQVPPPNTAGRDWDFNLPTRPDAIIVNLGTNDFYRPGNNYTNASFIDGFTSTYAEFCYNLTKMYYSNVPVIFLGVGPITTVYSDAVLDTIALTQSKYNMSNVHYLNMSGAALDGCDSHPGIIGHQQMAAMARPQILAVMGWASESSPLASSPESAELEEDVTPVGYRAPDDNRIAADYATNLERKYAAAEAAGASIRQGRAAASLQIDHGSAVSRDRASPTGDITLVVRSDGSGQFTSVQAALDFCNSTTDPTLGHVLLDIQGRFYEQVYVESSFSAGVSFVGTGAAPQDALITFDRPGGLYSTWYSQTVMVQARNVTIINMALANNAANYNSTIAGQSVALHVDVTADQFSCWSCELLGAQDTIYTGGAGYGVRSYFYSTYSNGTCDAWFGGSSTVLEQNTIEMDFTVFAPRGDSTHAYLVLDSSLTTTNGVLLARPWGQISTVVFKDTFMGKGVNPTGWDDWGEGCTAKHSSWCQYLYFAEYNSTGPGADPSQRAWWSHQLTAAEAANWTRPGVLRGWEPEDTLHPSAAAAVLQLYGRERLVDTFGAVAVMAMEARIQVYKATTGVTFAQADQAALPAIDLSAPVVGDWITVTPGSKVCNVLNYGAKGDGVSNDTIALQAALDDCSSTSAGGTVVFPAPYTFLSNGLLVNKADNFVVSVQGTLRFSNNTGVWSQKYQSCLTFNGGGAIAMTGAGLVDGNGYAWWKEAGKTGFRPGLIKTGGITDVLIKNLTFINSPNHQLELFSVNQEIVDTTILADPPCQNPPNPDPSFCAHNTDGIDTHNGGATGFAYVHRCTISTGDDNVAIHGNNTLIEDCDFGYGHGTSIGSLGQGTYLYNITVRNNRYNGTEQATRIKSDPGATGILTGVKYSNLTMVNVGQTILLTMFYPSPDPSKHTTLKITNITFADITSENALTAGQFMCDQNSPCENLLVTSVVHTGTQPKTGWQCSYAHGVQTDNVPSVCIESDDASADTAADSPSPEEAPSAVVGGGGNPVVGDWITVTPGSKVCNVMDYGAKGDGVTDDTAAIQKALSDCTSDSSGGTLLFPAPFAFLSFALETDTASNFVVDVQGTLRFSNNTSAWNKRMASCFLIQGTGAVALTGGGLVDGNGYAWWLHGANAFRPALITTNGLTDVLVKNLTFIDSPNHQLRLYSVNQEVVDTTIFASPPCQYPANPNLTFCAYNTDGIDTHNSDPAGGGFSYVHRCNINTGDDNVAIHGNNTLIEDCEFGYGHGTSIGSLGQGTYLKNITIRDSSYNGTWTALRIKSDPGATGILANVSYANLTISNVLETILITMFYPQPDPSKLTTLKISNISFIDITSDNAAATGDFLCDQNSPCEGLVVENVVHTGQIPKTGWNCSYAHGAMSNVVPPLCLEPLQLESTAQSSAPAFGAPVVGDWITVTPGAKVCNVLNYGAKGDGITNDTVALQAAVDDCTSDSTGGTVVMPTGYTFLSNALVAHNPNNFVVSIAGTLLFSNDTSVWNQQYSKCFTFDGSGTGAIAMTGGGVVDGNGYAWYALGENAFRPGLIQTSDLTDVLIHNLTFVEAPNHQLELFSVNQEVVDTRIFAHPPCHDPVTPTTFCAHNTDGIDTHNGLRDGSGFSYVHRCVISTGDDNVAIHGNNTLIEDCWFGEGHGTSIGSLGVNTYLRNITVRNSHYNATEQATRIKSDPGATGYLTDVTYTNLTMDGVGATILVDMFYPIGPDPSKHTTLQISNITFSDITSLNAAWTGELLCDQNSPCEGVIVSNVQHTGVPPALGWNCSWAYGTATDNVPAVCLI